MDSVTVVIPTLNRLDNVERVVENINEVTEDCQILIIYSSLVCQKMADLCKKLFTRYDNVEYIGAHWKVDIGDYARKINLSLDHCCTDWLFTGADDLRFHANWFENAMQKASGSAYVIGTQDLGNPRVLQGAHATHFLVNCAYARSHPLVPGHPNGMIFCPEYWHEFMDDELVCWSKKKGIWTFAEDSIVEHLHPHWGKAPSDKVYDQFKTRLVYGKNVFEKRKFWWT